MGLSPTTDTLFSSLSAEAADWKQKTEIEKIHWQDTAMAAYQADCATQPEDSNGYRHKAALLEQWQALFQPVLPQTANDVQLQRAYHYSRWAQEPDLLEAAQETLRSRGIHILSDCLKNTPACPQYNAFRLECQLLLLEIKHLNGESIKTQEATLLTDIQHWLDTQPNTPEDARLFDRLGHVFAHNRQFAQAQIYFTNAESIYTQNSMRFERDFSHLYVLIQQYYRESKPPQRLYWLTQIYHFSLSLPLSEPYTQQLVLLDHQLRFFETLDPPCHDKTVIPLLVARQCQYRELTKQYAETLSGLERLIQLLLNPDEHFITQIFLLTETSPIDLALAYLEQYVTLYRREHPGASLLTDSGVLDLKLQFPKSHQLAVLERLQGRMETPLSSTPFLTKQTAATRKKSDLLELQPP